MSRILDIHDMDYIANNVQKVCLCLLCLNSNRPGKFYFLYLPTNTQTRRQQASHNLVRCRTHWFHCGRPTLTRSPRPVVQTTQVETRATWRWSATEAPRRECWRRRRVPARHQMAVLLTGARSGLGRREPDRQQVDDTIEYVKHREARTLTAWPQLYSTNIFLHSVSNVDLSQNLGHRLRICDFLV